MLYIISTPIGNLKDISDRARDTLSKVENIICEDTRRTGILLKSIGIESKKNLIVANDFSEKTILNKINPKEDYALVTDNGTPGISDPGNIVINHFRKNNLEITHIPGPSAFVSALILSGFDSEHFSFYGFLPKSESQIEDTISELLKRKETIIFYESPHRIDKTLKTIEKHFPELRICIARELTKKFEETIIGTANEIIAMKKEILGEIVLIVDGKNFNNEESEINEETIKAVFESIRKDNKTDKKEAIQKTSEILRINRKKVYEIIK